MWPQTRPPAPVPAAAATCRHARTHAHTHPRAPTRAHTQHSLLSLSPPSLWRRWVRSLNQARPVLPTPSCPRRATVPSPATLSAPRSLPSSPFPASALPRAGATIAVRVGLGGVGPAVAGAVRVAVLPFLQVPPSSRPPPAATGHPPPAAPAAPAAAGGVEGPRRHA